MLLKTFWYTCKKVTNILKFDDFLNKTIEIIKLAVYNSTKHYAHINTKKT